VKVAARPRRKADLTSNTGRIIRPVFLFEYNRMAVDREQSAQLPGSIDSGGIDAAATATEIQDGQELEFPRA
jgi:hypothetical protein